MKLLRNLLLLLNFVSILSYNCVHDKINHTHSLGEANERMLVEDFPQIRIYPHYDLLENDSYGTYIKNDLVPPVIDYFKDTLQIKYPSSTLKFSSTVTSLCGTKTPSILFSGVNTDFFIFFITENDLTDLTIASASPCFLSSATKRPLVARVIFNRDSFKEANGDILRHERNTYVLMHEMIHAFGFSGSMFKYYPDNVVVKNISLNGSYYSVLDIPALTTKLRNYFGCTTLEGLYLEDDGGSGTAGSHMERKQYFYEVMTSGAMNGLRISEFSLGVLEGSGWYVVNYNNTEPFFYGQGQGCSFLKGSCSSLTFSEFCPTLGERGCMSNGETGGICTADPKADGCKSVLPASEYDCSNEAAMDYARFPNLQSYGNSDSRCFEGNLTQLSKSTQTSFCFKYSCVNSTLKVLIGGNYYSCSKGKKIIVSGYNGYVECPDPIEFCNTVGKKYCPRGCMGRGTCVNGKCSCKVGYFGLDCSSY